MVVVIIFVIIVVEIGIFVAAIIPLGQLEKIEVVVDVFGVNVASVWMDVVDHVVMDAINVWNNAVNLVVRDVVNA